MDEHKRRARVGLWADYPYDKPVIKRVYMPLGRTRMKQELPKLRAQAEDELLERAHTHDCAICETCGDCHVCCPL